jgi:hypothetical protein
MIDVGNTLAAIGLVQVIGVVVTDFRPAIKPSKPTLKPR